MRPTTQAAIVLAAGKGTRMKSRTPKVLHRVCGREMVRLVVDAATDAGYDTTVVIASDSEAIRDSLGDRVAYAVQRDQHGSGHALLQAQELRDGVENVIVLNADLPLVRPETIASLMLHHQSRAACVTLVTAVVDDPDGLGRVVRDESGSVTAVVEQRDADQATLAIREVNCGLYGFRTSWLWPRLSGLPPSSGGELYLTDLVAAAARDGETVVTMEAAETQEVIGVNNRLELARAEAVLRHRILERWMLAGVTMPDPASVYIGHDATIGPDTTVHPNTHIEGRSRIGDGCEIGPNSIVEESKVGDGCRVVSSVVRGATLEAGVEVGPFSHIRPGTHLENDVHIGSFAEVKNSRLGAGTMSGHFSYVGDAQIGARVNIGAGTVTCNFDGIDKHATIIEDGAFIGCDTMLVAPLRIGARSKTGAGAVVTKDVPPDSLAVGVPARVRPSKGRRKRS